MSKQEILAGNRVIMSTDDYGLFKQMKGNRLVDQNHVKELQGLMLTNGNLTDQFPIVVNKRMEVIDGQHRLEALKGLGWNVCFIKEDDANITMVRAINLGNKNWDWRDMAESYAELGNKEYRWFINFIDKYEINFSLASRLTGLKSRGRNALSSPYYVGDLIIENKEDVIKQAEHLKEALSYTSDTMSTHDFGFALLHLMQSPAYNESRMLDKLKQKGYKLPDRASRADMLRVLEELFNSGWSEENKVRLF